MTKTRLYPIYLILLLCFLTTRISAQPESVKQAAQAVFTLTTFQEDGTILSSSHGVFVGENGEAISPWSPFIGAHKAVVIDTNGKKLDVDVILGANELYDICKFRTVASQTFSASIAKQPSAEGEKVWLSDYSVKKTKFKALTISKTEKFMKDFTYYIFTTKQPEALDGCPFLNQQGEIIGFLKHTKKKDEVTATDAALTNTFELNGLSMNNTTLRQTQIRIAMPQDIESARLTLLMAGQKNDSAKYAAYIEDFIRMFPEAVDGYTAKAQNEVNARNFGNAVACMEEAISKVENKDEAHSSYATLIFNKVIYQPDTLFKDWTLEKALEEATTANSLHPQPIYQHQQARIHYSLGNYQEAYNIFNSLTQSSIRNGEVFYEAAQCKMQLKAPREEIMALLDSAINVQKPLSAISAPYILARGRMYDTNQEYKKALLDYNLYDSLMNGRADADFYYLRYKCETHLRSYQQALNDIAHAILINRREPLYYAEMASLQLKVRYFEDAIKTSEMCIAIAPEYADPYIIKGIALAESGQRESAIETFNRAKELGDERADALMEKYK